MKGVWFMATIQSYFSKFYENIKLKSTEENAILKSKISADTPSVTITDHGSYVMKTGVKPLFR